jgi:hypothetical protein
MYSPLGVKTPHVFTTGELIFPGVFITKELFWTLRSRITDFKEHTTIFKGSVILKIECRLLRFEKLPNCVQYFARESVMNTKHSVDILKI